MQKVNNCERTHGWENMPFEIIKFSFHVSGKLLAKRSDPPVLSKAEDWRLKHRPHPNSKACMCTTNRTTLLNQKFRRGFEEQIRQNNRGYITLLLNHVFFMILQLVSCFPCKCFLSVVKATWRKSMFGCKRKRVILITSQITRKINSEQNNTHKTTTMSEKAVYPEWENE